MIDTTHAHNLTAQIISSYCQGGNPKTIFQDGEDLGRLLGKAYQELFNHISQVQGNSKPTVKGIGLG